MDLIEIRELKFGIVKWGTEIGRFKVKKHRMQICFLELTQAFVIPCTIPN